MRKISWKPPLAPWLPSAGSTRSHTLWGDFVRSFTRMTPQLNIPRSFHNTDSIRSSSAPGNAVDWMYQRRAVKYSYAVHLRDTGTVSLEPFTIHNSHPISDSHSALVRVFAAARMDPASWGRDFEAGRVSRNLHHHQAYITRAQMSDIGMMREKDSENMDSYLSIYLTLCFTFQIPSLVVRYTSEKLWRIRSTCRLCTLPRWGD